MIVKAGLNANGEAKCFLEAIHLEKVPVDITRVCPGLWSFYAAKATCLPQGCVVVDDVPVPRCNSGTGSEMTARMGICTQWVLCRAWQDKSRCGGRSLGKLPESALRSTYVLHPSHSASETVTSGSRKGAGSHRGNNINYQSCFSSLGLPMAWHIN